MRTTTLNYTVTFLSDWHAGSGLAAGAETDAEVIKDGRGLPYLPGKTIKGLLKHACQDIANLQPQKIAQEAIDRIFGNFDEEAKKSQAGTAFFTNANLADDESDEIVTNNLQRFLYRNIASTQISDKGTAQVGSLRTMEICIPLSLQGRIELEESNKAIMELAIKWVRHIGANRNRGLGRCKITLDNK
jgi:CRISPR/Cas system CSM-associated protein Csm3 (group 7 of RAMP superfamily)